MDYQVRKALYSIIKGFLKSPYILIPYKKNVIFFFCYSNWASLVRCVKKLEKLEKNILFLIYSEIYLVEDVMHGIKIVKIFLADEIR